MTTTTDRMPILYLSHGAPPLADDDVWTRQLADWSAALPRPRNILMVSAHWENAPLSLSATRGTRPLVYDFWGFPEKYYSVTYDAPLAPDLAEDVQGLVGDLVPGGVGRDETRGLDHGAYVPLVEMFPEADVPVVQMSMPTLDPRQLFELGSRLAPLRDQGTLIVGSGFTTHNLAWFNPRLGADVTPPTPSSEFDHWAAEALERGDVDAVLNFENQAPAAREAHPRTEHWAPLYLALGAADASGGVDSDSVIDGFWFGLSKRSWQFV
ncbi:4,5-DOPA dioxygenase extradiol [Ornithinimicrobium cerasi]|uniref:4,5-DOPA dioxygenase extradiol n=2 Tax=Ornithinimicrobium cerasi TaxID=2248773 RepID=A0A285VNC9_9MICO|nr:class III extradiol ring-cleavage dioxygenase [Ornithinimicrobium cerasi]SOC55569.1 4,5-DOPA dioxygenase extradiol [Ornithinimicrobium cerasi]